MKKIFVFSSLLFALACSNPEDRATGDPDSTSFNQNEKNNTNSRDFNNETGSARPDTSAAPALDKENANSRTEGTNRAYGGGRDSAK